MQRLANGGPVLELGIGTGRIALPLSARGVKVYGIEASHSMIIKLGEKPGSAQLKVLHGNFADTRMEIRFSLVFALVSTFYLLRSHSEQQRSLHTLAGGLSEGGLLLLENYKPARLEPVAPSDVNDGEVYFSEHLLSTAEGPRYYRARICYAPPQELDKMAAKAGLRLRERWSNWQGQIFKTGDPRHISIYESVK
ncbi:MAG: class I SAM-dependent methyltransferase [Pyrinomonadaceae bacterium]